VSSPEVPSAASGPGACESSAMSCAAGRNGVIPDIAEAVESPRLLTTDLCRARRVLDLAPSVPALVWGRDQLAAGEMWNSNSFISWLLERSGVDAESIHPPVGGRAPGWQAGLVIARRVSVAIDARRPDTSSPL